MIGYQRSLYMLPQNNMKFYTLLLLFVIFFAAVSAWNPFPDDMKTRLGMEIFGELQLARARRKGCR